MDANANDKAPIIAPIPDTVVRPRWSVMIPTYNCADYLRQTLECVLAQDPGPDQMQIEVIDDCSTKDDPEAVVKEIGKGRVAFYRKPQNEGVVAAFNTCLERSRGHLIHILHGDDLVGQGFYQTVQATFDNAADIKMVVVRTFTMDAAGEVETLLPRLVHEPGTHYTWSGFFNSHLMPFAGVVVQRAAYEALGGYLPLLPHVNDWEMWDRVITRYGFVYINKPLAYYRIFEANDTGRLARTGQNLQDDLRLIPIFKARHAHFDETQFRRMVAKKALNQYKRFADAGATDAAQANLAIWWKLAPTQTKAKFYLKHYWQKAKQLLARK